MKATLTPTQRIVGKLARSARNFARLARSEREKETVLAHYYDGRAEALMGAARTIKELCDLNSLFTEEPVLPVQLRKDEARGLLDLCEYRLRGKVQPHEIVEQFIADLTHSERTSGSDEREFAMQYLQRTNLCGALLYGLEVA
ncbi:MAG TPA: hypothetical protein VNT99_08400 [Methylomirabilota bacterium]|nr:hypothetical protein [Methylomirabilota bacterium]